MTALVLMVLGLLAVTAGAAWIYPPAGLIVAGVLLVVAGLAAYMEGSDA